MVIVVVLFAGYWYFVVLVLDWFKLDRGSCEGNVGEKMLKEGICYHIVLGMWECHGEGIEFMRQPYNSIDYDFWMPKQQ